MKKAFTLIELLIVVAIIAIVAAVVLPAVKRAKPGASAVSGLTIVESTGGTALERPSSFVTDLTSTLPATVVSALNERLAQLERDTTAQVVVYMAGTLPLGEDLEALCNRTFKSWGAGQQGRNNGVALFIFKDSRKMRLEVGYGLEGGIPDAVAKRIVSEQLSPRFKVGDYAGGVSAAVDQLATLIRAEVSKSPAGQVAGKEVPAAGLPFGRSLDSSLRSSSPMSALTGAESSAPSSRPGQSPAAQAAQAATLAAEAAPAEVAQASVGSVTWTAVGGIALVALALVCVALAASRLKIRDELSNERHDHRQTLVELDRVNSMRVLAQDTLAAQVEKYNALAARLAKAEDELEQLRDPVGYLERKKAAQAEAARRSESKAKQAKAARVAAVAAVAAAVVGVSARKRTSRTDARPYDSRSDDGGGRSVLSSSSSDSSSGSSDSSSSFDSGGGSSGGGGASGDW